MSGIGNVAAIRSTSGCADGVESLSAMTTPTVAPARSIRASEFSVISSSGLRKVQTPIQISGA